MTPSVDTVCVQGGYRPGNGEPRQVPIVQSTTFKYDTGSDMAKLFDLEASGYFYSRLTLLWYNPNIYPQAEFDRRFQTLIKLIEDMGLADRVTVMAEARKSEDYYARVKGLEDEPEGGKRCTECFRLRLLETARLAKHYGFDYFCTTLTLSRHKDAVRINDLAEEIARATGVAWLPSDFKKRDGENRSIELCEQYNVYRQLYCGCEYSLHRREEGAPQPPLRQGSL